MSLLDKLKNPKKFLTKGENGENTGEAGAQALANALNSFKEELTLDHIMSLKMNGDNICCRTSSTSDKKEMLIEDLFEKVMEESKVNKGGMLGTFKIWYNLTYRELKSISSKNQSIVKKAMDDKEYKSINLKARKKAVEKACDRVKRAFHVSAITKALGKNSRLVQKSVEDALSAICEKINGFKNDLPTKAGDIKEGNTATSYFLGIKKGD